MIPYGYCHCGCGEKTTVPTKTNRSTGRAKGIPMRYIRGHAARAERVDTRWIEEDRGFDTPCWVWQLYTDENGHGKVRVAKRGHQAHRYYYEQENGVLDEGLHLHHCCEVPSCVNPAHLKPVTPGGHRRLHPGRRMLLTVSDVAEIKRIGRSIPGVELARKYGVDKTTIYAVLSGKTWKEVQPA